MWFTIRAIAFAVVAFAAVSRALPTTAAADSVPPAITKATMQDKDGDGRADRVVLTYSEKVIFDGATGGGPFSVAGYVITGAGHTHAQTTVTIILKEKPAADPTAKPAVTYTPFACGAPAVVDLAGNEAAAQVFRGTKSLGGGRDPDAAAPAAPPRIIAAAMQDADDDGRADRLELTYSTAVNYPGQPSGSALFTVNGYQVKKVGKAVDSTTLLLFLREKSSPDPKAAPDVGYCAPKPASGEVPVRRSDGPGGANGTPAKTQKFVDTTSVDDAPTPTVTMVTVGQLGPGIAGKLKCTGAFVKVDFVRTPGTIHSTGFGRCKATFVDVPRGATVEISILGTAGVTATAVGGCSDFDAIANAPADDSVRTDDLELTRSGFGECVL